MSGLEQLIQGLSGGQGSPIPQGGMSPQGMPPSSDMSQMDGQAPMPSIEQVMMIIQMLKNMGLINEQAMMQVLGGGQMGGQPNPMMGGMSGGIPAGL